jgi:hypothetical protein
VARASTALALCALVTVSTACATAPEPPPPDAAMVADLCALLAAPDNPEHYTYVYEDSLKAAPMLKRLEESGRVFNNGPRGRSRMPWKHCPSRGAPYDHFLTITPDGLLARREGSWKADSMSFGSGDCIYEKASGGWKLVFCTSTIHEGPL